MQKRLEHPLPSPPCNFSNKVISCLYCWLQDKCSTLPLTTNYSFWGEISPLTTCKTLPSSLPPSPFPPSPLPHCLSLWYEVFRDGGHEQMTSCGRRLKPPFAKRYKKCRQWLISDESRCPPQTAFKIVGSVQSKTLKKLGDAFLQYCLTWDCLTWDYISY